MIQKDLGRLVGMIAVMSSLVLVGCGTEPEEEPAETQDMWTLTGDDMGAEDMSEPVDQAKGAGDLPDEMHPFADMHHVDMNPVEDMPADMPPAEDMPEDMEPVDMPDLLDMPEDMEPVDMAPMDLDMRPDMYPPVTSDPLMGGGRAADVILPTGFDNSHDVPLIIALHGYGGNSAEVPRYFSLAGNVDSKDFIIVAPNGTPDLIGSKFWNATDACCDGFNNGVDDVAYIRDLISEAKQRFAIDAGRVYVVGYSNGGFMSHRMACDAADVVTGIFSLAGATYKDISSCNPSRPVAVFQLHGTADQTIKYEGGSAYPGGAQHPSALDTVTNWATLNGCTPTPVMLDNTEVNAVVVDETTVTGFNNCPTDGTVELWTIDGAPHNPQLYSTFGPMLLDRLFAFDRTP